LRLSPVGARVAVIASKNVPAPGKGAAAYSASKAALTQLSRVAALEWAEAGIRINLVHPDAAFDTGLWSEELIAQRADQYGLTANAYRRRNLLAAEVTLPPSRRWWPISARIVSGPPPEHKSQLMVEAKG